MERATNTRVSAPKSASGPSPLRQDANAGQVALVSGGGTGLGRAITLALARSGARVAICGRRSEPLRETAAEITAMGGVCHVEIADVRDPEAVQRLVAGVLERFGKIDVLVNNAGGQFLAAAEDISDRGWRAVGRLNLDAVWSMTRTCAVSSMIPRQRGLVVFIGFSPARGIPGFAHAATARAGIATLASSLALEWSVHGIRTVCLGVGIIRTEATYAYPDELMSGWEKAIPAGRLGEPDDVADLVAFLASAGGAYITGSTIFVDGGLNAAGPGAAFPAGAGVSTAGEEGTTESDGSPRRRGGHAHDR